MAGCAAYVWAWRELVVIEQTAIEEGDALEPVARSGRGCESPEEFFEKLVIEENCPAAPGEALKWLNR